MATFLGRQLALPQRSQCSLTRLRRRTVPKVALFAKFDRLTATIRLFGSLNVQLVIRLAYGGRIPVFVEVYSDIC